MKTRSTGDPDIRSLLCLGCPKFVGRIFPRLGSPTAPGMISLQLYKTWTRVGV